MNKKPIITERGKRLEMVISMTGLKVIDFSRESKIGISTLRNWINGRGSGLSEKGSKKIINFVMQKGINCNLPWLMSGAGSLPRFDQTFRSQVRDAEAYVLVESNYKKLTKEYQLFLDSYPNSITTVLADDSMSPYYEAGEMVGGVLFAPSKFDECVGKDCIVITDKDGVVVRRFVKGGEQNLYTLFCLNPSTKVFPPVVAGVKVKGVAPITRIWRELNVNDPQS